MDPLRALRVRQAWVAAAVVVVLTSGLPHRASLAQQPPGAGPATGPAPSPAALAQAKVHFDRGLRLYEEGLFREALGEFDEARRLAPRASIQRNIAQCLRDLKDLPGAHAAYRELLERHRDTMSVEEVAEANRALQELEAITGTIDLSRVAPATEVTLDGVVVGVTPLVPIRVPTGTHRIQLRHEGKLPGDRPVNVEAGAAVVVDGALEEAPTTGRLVVTTTDQDVDLFVDGSLVGRGRFEGDLAAGSHRVRAVGPGRSTPDRVVEVATGATVHVVLEPVAETGRVRLEGPPGAEIRVDGQLVARGSYEGILLAGVHVIDVQLDGHLSHRSTIDVHAGETATRTVRLERAPPDPSEDAGVYVRLGVMSMFGPPPDSVVTQSCEENATSCVAYGAIGAGLTLRVGYSFGWLGLEGTVLGSYDRSSGELDFDDPSGRGDGTLFGPRRTEEISFHQWGGGLLIGPRFTLPSGVVRPTFATSMGWTHRGFTYVRSARAKDRDAYIDSLAADASAFTAPALTFDAGCLFGSVPGPRFGIALTALLELPGNVAAGPVEPTKFRAVGSAAQVPVNDGPRFLVGPELILQLGH